MAISEKTHRRLIVALALAENEIHHPGAASDDGFDLHAMIEGVLEEADPTGLAREVVADDYCRKFLAPRAA